MRGYRKKLLNNSRCLLFWKSWRAAALARHIFLVLKFTISSTPAWSKSNSKLELEIIHSQPHMSSHQPSEPVASPLSKYHWKQSKVIGFTWFTSVVKAQTESSFISFESQQLLHFYNSITSELLNMLPITSLRSFDEPALGYWGYQCVFPEETPGAVLKWTIDCNFRF